MRIAAGEFKSKCLKLMDKVSRDHEEIVITKRGKPVAKLVPVTDVDKPRGYGCMKGTGQIVGDIVSPIDVEWEADRYHATSSPARHARLGVVRV